MTVAVPLDVQVQRTLSHLTDTLVRLEPTQPERARLRSAAIRRFDDRNTYFPRGPLRTCVEALVADIAMGLENRDVEDALLVLTRTSGDVIDRMLSGEARLALDEVWPQGAPEFLAKVSTMCLTTGL